MTEEQIKGILDSKSYMEAIKKIAKVYPSGFDIDKIDERIKYKLEELTNKYDSIEMPIQIRRKKALTKK